MECVDTPTGGIQEQTHVTNCETTCEIGWEYVPATPESKQCCGTCKQVACVVDGEIRKIGEEWSTDDFCTHFVCSNLNDSVRFFFIIFIKKKFFSG